MRCDETQQQKEEEDMDGFCALRSDANGIVLYYYNYSTGESKFATEKEIDASPLKQMVTLEKPKIKLEQAPALDKHREELQRKREAEEIPQTPGISIVEALKAVQKTSAAEAAAKKVVVAAEAAAKKVVAAETPTVIVAKKPTAEVAVGTKPEMATEVKAVKKREVDTTVEVPNEAAVVKKPQTVDATTIPENHVAPKPAKKHNSATEVMEKPSEVAAAKSSFAEVVKKPSSSSTTKPPIVAPAKIKQSVKRSSTDNEESSVVPAKPAAIPTLSRQNSSNTIKFDTYPSCSLSPSFNQDSNVVFEQRFQPIGMELAKLLHCKINGKFSHPYQAPSKPNEPLQPYIFKCNGGL